MRQVDRALDNCLKCTDCVTVCPVVRVCPDFPGPKRLGPDLERHRKEGMPCDTAWLEYCLGCHGCDLACPHGVNVSELITAAKATHRKHGRRSVRDHLLSRPGLLGQVASGLVPISNLLLRSKLNRWVMLHLLEIAGDRSLPEYAAKPVRSVCDVRSNKHRILFFPGCFTRYNDPHLSDTVVQLLRMNGFEVDVIAADCCGVPALANGDGTESVRAARKNVAAMIDAVRAGTRIVTACTSCGYALKAEYPRLLANTEFEDSAKEIASSTYDLAELLAGLLDEGMLNCDFTPTALKLAYHAPCHLKSQGIGRPWLRLLRTVPGIEIEEIKADCCGMSGTYGFKQEKYGISVAIARDLCERIAAYQPDAVITECASCQMQIAHGTRFKVMHPAVLLRSAYKQ